MSESLGCTLDLQGLASTPTTKAKSLGSSCLLALGVVGVGLGQPCLKRSLLRLVNSGCCYLNRRRGTAPGFIGSTLQFFDVALGLPHRDRIDSDGVTILYPVRDVS